MVRVLKLASITILLIIAPRANGTPPSQIKLARTHIQSCKAAMESVFSGRLLIEIKTKKDGEAAKSIAKGIYTFDLVNDLASFDQLERQPPLFWMITKDCQFAYVGVSNNRRLKIYPREKQLNISGLQLCFDIRSLPVVQPIQLTNDMPHEPFLSYVNDEDIKSVAGNDSEDIITVESRFKSAKDAVESMPESVQDQILELVHAGIANEDLPVKRSRHTFVFDSTKVGLLRKFDLSSSPFGTEKWTQLSSNVVSWEVKSGVNLPNHVRIMDMIDHVDYEVDVIWEVVNDNVEHHFDVEGIAGLQGMVVVDTRFEESVEVGIVGSVKNLPIVGIQPRSGRFWLVVVNAFGLLGFAAWYWTVRRWRNTLDTNPIHDGVQPDFSADQKH